MFSGELISPGELGAAIIGLDVNYLVCNHEENRHLTAGITLQ